MQKFLAFMERNVQWFALGLGAIYLLWTVWAYVLTPPLSVQMDGKTVLPGEVDQTIAAGPIRDLQNDIAKKEAIPFPIPDLVRLITERLDENTAVAAKDPFMPTGVDVIPGSHENDHQNGEAALQRIETLPEPPPAEPKVVGQIRTVVLMPEADAETGAAALPAADGRVAPERPRPAIAHGDPALGAANGGARPGANGKQVSGNEVDMDIVTFIGTVDLDKLAEQFKKCFKGNVPQSIFQTEFLKVQLMREEQVGVDADGTPIWGKPTVVKPLSIHPLPPFPGDVVKDVAGQQAAQTYVAWVSEHSDDLLDPKMYDTAPGAPTYHPPDAPATDVKQPPVQPLPPPLPPIPQRPVLPPPGRTTPRPPSQRNSGRRTGGSGSSNREYLPLYAPADPDRALADSRTPIYLAQMPPNVTPPGPGGPWGGPYMPPTGQGWQAPIPGQGQPQVHGLFNPSTIGGKLRIVAHDDSAVAGKTYRYSLIYKIKNPVFGTMGLAQPQSLAERFALTSPQGPWSDPITIPVKMHFFVASIRSSDVRFDVFSWAKGQWSLSHSSAAPGDSVGSTGWTVVDIRRDQHGSQDYYAILLNPQGQLTQRDFRDDQKDPKHDELLTDVNGKQTNAQTPGTPPWSGAGGTARVTRP